MDTDFMSQTRERSLAEKTGAVASSFTKPVQEGGRAPSHTSRGEWCEGAFSKSEKQVHGFFLRQASKTKPVFSLPKDSSFTSSFPLSPKRTSSKRREG